MIVFCKVRGRYIDAHKITKISQQGNIIKYLISNNKGHDNGWTTIIYGRVEESEDPQGRIKRFPNTIDLNALGLTPIPNSYINLV